MIRRLCELAAVFFRIGATSFGGPAVYIAIMEAELVRQRHWLTPEEFVDLLGATNLIPGPNATEVALYIGYHRAGLLGMLVTALAYVSPSMVISGLLAWGYVRYGELPAVTPYLAGIKPVVLALLIGALWRLVPTAMKSWQTWLIGLGVIVAARLQADQVATLFVATLLGMVLLRLTRRGMPVKTAASLLGGAIGSGVPSYSGARAMAGEAALAAGGVAAAGGVSLWQIGWFFLKVGAVLYGSGYVIVAYIEGDLVNPPWNLTHQQVLDAVAAGQITPGPFVSTASFVGYLLGGWPGTLVATLAINLPSLVLVALTFRWIRRMRQWQWTSYLLDAVNAAALGLMAAVCITLGGETLIDWPSVLLAAAALIVILRWKVSPIWLVVAGALLGRLIVAFIPFGAAP